MSDVISGLRQVIQDLVAPELKSHTVKLDAIQKQMDAMQSAMQKQMDANQSAMQKQMESMQKHSEMQYETMAKTLDAFRAEMRSEFASLRMNNQMEVLREVSPLSQRMAVVEARLDQR